MAISSFGHFGNLINCALPRLALSLVGFTMVSKPLIFCTHGSCDSWMILAAGSLQLVIRSLHSLYQLNILRLRQLNIHKTASPLGLGHIFRDWARGPLGVPSGKNIIRFRRWANFEISKCSMFSIILVEKLSRPVSSSSQWPWL